MLNEMNSSPHGLQNTDYVMLVLLAIGVGSLSSITLFHLLPEAWEDQGFLKTLLFFVLGYAFLFILSWIVHRSCRHRHYNHDLCCNHHDPLAGIVVNMTASCTHSVQDGLMLGVSFLHGVPAGIVALYSTVFHEIPKKLGDYSFLRARTSLVNTILLLSLSVCATLASAIFVIALGIHVNESHWLTALLAGGFAYYVWGHMLPDLIYRSKEIKISWFIPTISVIVGLLLMLCLVHFMGHI